ncbi:gtp-binding protein [Stylonychia lemnae]|uniref:Gtp-binding protein n=1 Tax=Stylonychia lemnae TaxID=5949 RepID=A0A078B7M5_STYLE|nr:gtp-binding protein [Stylonychia lemnae]|eukprot:CDW90510.1 gtp-binding protein [Stylonychia lemnae]
MGQKLADASKTPGKTQNLFFFRNEMLKAHIVDCPGYGYAEAADSQKEYLHRLVLLIDMSVGLMDSDKVLIDMLSNSHKPFMIVLTKADKVKEQDIPVRMQEVADFMRKAGSICSPIVHIVCARYKYTLSENFRDGYGLQEFMANLIYILQMSILRKPT